MLVLLVYSFYSSLPVIFANLVFADGGADCIKSNAMGRSHDLRIDGPRNTGGVMAARQSTERKQIDKSDESGITRLGGVTYVVTSHKSK
jgi:hypothetical protein